VSSFDSADADTCSCGSQQKFQEVVKINSHWHSDYNSLLEDHKKLETDLWKTKSALGMVEYDRQQLGMKVNHLETSMKKMKMEEAKKHESTIQALKMQCTIYEEDFKQERSDREKYTQENIKLKSELTKAYGVIDNLATQTRTLKQSLRNVSTENEELLSSLRSIPERNPAKVGYHRTFSEPARKVSISDDDVFLNQTYRPILKEVQNSPYENNDNFLTLMNKKYPSFQGGSPVCDYMRGSWE
jgi:CII-binding regulator of phage lambda lysogenization HflD